MLKIIEVRNLIYHSNHISVRQAEQTFCYSNDIIDSIKAYYKNENKEMDFNAPIIIKYSDSNGMNFFRDQFIIPTGNRILYFKDTKQRCGDKIRMEIEVDASFSPYEYTIEWAAGNQTLSSSTTVDIQFKEEDVSEVYQIIVTIKSNKSWHRHKYYDDSLTIMFPVLPPIK